MTSFQRIKTPFTESPADEQAQRCSRGRRLVGELLQRAARGSRPRPRRDRRRCCGSSRPIWPRSSKAARTICPGPTYAIGFVRAYADFLGLDAEAVLDRFKAEAAGVTARPDLALPVPLGERSLPGGALVLVALILALCGYGIWYYLSTERAQPAGARRRGAGRAAAAADAAGADARAGAAAAARRRLRRRPPPRPRASPPARRAERAARRRRRRQPAPASPPPPRRRRRPPRTGAGGAPPARLPPRRHAGRCRQTPRRRRKPRRSRRRRARRTAPAAPAPARRRLGRRRAASTSARVADCWIQVRARRPVDRLLARAEIGRDLQRAGASRAVAAHRQCRRAGRSRSTASRRRRSAASARCAATSRSIPTELAAGTAVHG